MYYSYILKSLKNGRHYYGYSANLDERIKYHNAGWVRSTKAFRPWIIHFFEEHPTKDDARNRERFYKSIEGYL